VLIEDEAVAQAMVAAVTTDALATELVGYLILTPSGAEPIDTVRARLADRLHKRLPAYMRPSYLEVLDSLPMLPSGKADRSRLPAPVSPRLLGSAQHDFAPPSTPLETQVAEAFSSVFGPSPVSVDADFFVDLGGHSLFAATVISRLRKLEGLGHLGIGDLYAHPTVRSLALHIAESRPGLRTTAPPKPLDRLRHGNRRVIACGLAQLGLLYGLFLALSWPAFAWMHAGDLPDFVRTLLMAGSLVATMLTTLALPILSQGTLGRIKPGRYPLWGPTYLRWWIARKVLSLAPLDVLAGSPLMPIYARLLGASIGSN
jgi:hypothetical protein